MSHPTTIAHYRITSKLGEGGMGAVYRATDTKLNRDVAIKLLPSAFAADAARMTRFEREAQILASLNHPSIAAIYGIESGAIVMELVEGEEIKGPLPATEAIPIARQIAAGLEAAHEKGIIHRDLKPANIKVTRDGVVKLLDFGLAKAAEESAANLMAGTSPTMSPTMSLAMTQAGMILGTAAYMAPEQARGHGVDKRADIWAFGVVMYEMLTGTQLFHGDTVSDTLASVLRADIDFQKLPADTPPALRKLLRRCLERDRKRRLPDIGMVALELDEPSEANALPAVLEAKQSGRPWIAAGIAGLAAVVFAGLYFGRKAPGLTATAFEIPAPQGEHFHNGRISPDGKRMVFEVDTSQDSYTRTYLAIRSLDSVEMQKIPGTEGAATPFWSPDSRSIGYRQNGKLRRQELGGAPMPICDLPPAAAGGDWSMEGVILFTADEGVYRVPAAGGTPSRVPVKPPETRSKLHFLPNSRRYLFESGRNESGDIMAGSLDSAESTLLVENASDATVAVLPGQGARLLYLRDGTLMAQPFDPAALKLSGEPTAIARRATTPGDISGSASSTGTLAYMQYEGGDPRLAWRTMEAATDVAPFARYRDLALAPDGNRVAVTIRGEKQADIWIIRLAGGERTRLTLEPGTLGSPLWTPDGKQVVFSALRGGRAGLYRKAADGSGAEELLVELDGSAQACDFTRDGQFLLYSAVDANTKEDLWLLPMTGDRRPRPYLQTPHRETMGQISPDGRYLAYMSDESGGYQIYVSTFPDASAGRWQVAQERSSTPRWRPDGKQIFYIGSARRLRVVDVKIQPSFSSGAAQPLMGLPTYAGGEHHFDYAISPDRFRILGISDGRHQGPFVVMLNWFAKGSP